MTALEPAMGVIEDAEHRLPLRVYYEDTDAAGMVYHANYLRFAERGRTECLRLIGWPHRRLKDETGLGWVVRRAEIDFRAPARLDALIVATRLVALRPASATARQVIRRGTEELAMVSVELVLLTEAGRPARLPGPLRQAFLPLIQQESVP